MNFQSPSASISRMDESRKVPNFRQKAIPICFKEVEKKEYTDNEQKMIQLAKELDEAYRI